MKRILLVAVVAAALTGCSSQKAGDAVSLVDQYLSLKDTQECVKWMKENAVVLSAHPKWEEWEMPDADHYEDAITEACEKPAKVSKKYIVASKRYGKHTKYVDFLVVSPYGKTSILTFYMVRTAPSIEKKIARRLGRNIEQAKGRWRFVIFPVRHGWKYVYSPYEKHSTKNITNMKYVLVRMVAMGKCETAFRTLGNEDLKKNAEKYCEKLYDWTGKPLPEKYVLEKATVENGSLSVEYAEEREAHTFRGKKVKRDAWDVFFVDISDHGKAEKVIVTRGAVQFWDGSSWTPTPRKRKIPNSSLTYEEATTIIPDDLK